jgi:hypothetical protein
MKKEISPTKDALITERRVINSYYKNIKSSHTIIAEWHEDFGKLSPDGKKLVRPLVAALNKIKKALENNEFD